MNKNQRILVEAWVGVILLATSACAAPSQPTVTLAPAPTATTAPTLTATLAATATLAPTVKPSSTPRPSPTATAMLDPQEFYGTWTVFDRDAGGPNFLTFNADGTFVASHGLDMGQTLHKGTYTLEGNAITFESWWYCDADKQVATYLIHLYDDKKSVRFLPVEEPCEDRAYDFTNRIILWDRFVPTATPGM